MRRLAWMALAVLAGCSSAPLRIGSEIPPGAQLTPGRSIEGTGCNLFLGTGFENAYKVLVEAAGHDLITDVEVRGGPNCTTFRAKAVKIVAAQATAPPAPAAAASVAAPTQAPPDAALSKGTSAKLKPGGVVRTRPRPEGDPVAIGAAGRVQLGAHLRNETGSWWYVSGGGKSGWALENDLEPGAP